MKIGEQLHFITREFNEVFVFLPLAIFYCHSGVCIIFVKKRVFTLPKSLYQLNTQFNLIKNSDVFFNVGTKLNCLSVRPSYYNIMKSTVFNKIIV